MSYADLDSRLTGRCQQRRKVANNTWAERRGDSIALRLHSTDVVTYHPDGSITLDTGGWFTVTTKDRMNNALPKGTWDPDYCGLDECPGEAVDNHWHGRHVGLRGHVGSARGEWYVRWGLDDNGGYWDRDEFHHVYKDGITLHPDGTVTGAFEGVSLERQRKMVAWRKRQIKEYLALITPEKIVSAFENAGGDPWCCSMRTAEGERPMGADCVAEHLRTHAFFLSLAYRAVEARGYRDPRSVMQMIYADARYGRVSRPLTESLTKFFKSELIEGAAVR